MLKVANSVISASRITGVLPVVNGGTGVTTSTGTGNTVLSASPTLSGDVTLSTGSLIPSTAAKGVNFTANTPAAGMTSQLLNWYEEGTWTPTYVPSAGAFGAITYSSVTGGKYTRVGNTVYIQAFVRTDSITIGTASGVVLLGGLPFTSAANSSGKLDAYFGLVVNFSSGFTVTNPTNALGANSSTQAELYYRATAGGASTNLLTTALATGASSNTMVISGSYVCA